ncbi:secreted RxLR effector protein 161-like [Ricinus communis]|uniref:secreted RxLR effector protein 161-like n=1 Tax=Ricinus communis TaxID=3988 RepID=UPI00201A2EF9|nr:secreted RxLR effector protein 161-like [Ricinus communis]
MEKCKPVTTPLVTNQKLSKNNGNNQADACTFRSIVGGLLYLTATRPDIMFLVSLLSRFMHSPSQTHLCAAKRVLRYLKGTLDEGIWYNRHKNIILEGYVDSDCAGSVDDSKSTTGYIFLFGNGAFSWNSKKQDVVAQSSTEAEYIAAATTVNQALWINKILVDIA